MNSKFRIETISYYPLFLTMILGIAISLYLSVSFIVILLLSILLITDNLPIPANEFISIVQFITVFVFSFYLAHLIGMAKDGQWLLCLFPIIKKND